MCLPSGVDCCGNAMSLGAVCNLAVFSLAFPLTWIQQRKPFHIVKLVSW